VAIAWRPLAWGGLALLCAGLAWGSWQRLLPLGLTEVFGFATGAACVLLVVDESIWNFPVGIANNLFFFALFFSARLYADMTLQLVYVGLAIGGWVLWARGGAGGERLRVARASGRELLVLALLGAVATVTLAAVLRRVGGAAPGLDALTTVLSLIAQWLLNRKRLDNWIVWITADVLYVWLYVGRGLYLTAALYAIFLAMCVAGLARWRAAFSDASSSGGTIPSAAPR
jgi:nicotinamide mononucleotide transporter